MLINRSIERGLSLADLEVLTISQILDIMISQENEMQDDSTAVGNSNRTYWANQFDFDRF